MRKFLVNVNGSKYQVEVEELDAAAIPQTAPAAAPVAAPAPAAAPAAPAPAPVAAPVPAGGESITSPMPGNILQVNVSVGDTVKSGQTLMILEAMKMENEILAPRDGRIAAVAVAKGAQVESGTLLATIA